MPGHKPQHLIDVRSPAEFATGGLPGAINIEFTAIANLPDVVPHAARTDAITLYCRSGRRSAIALDELRRLGYADVRDIGALEEARAVLEAERRESGGGNGDSKGRTGGCGGCGGGGGGLGAQSGVGFGVDGAGLRESHRRLLEGLREAEGA